MTLFKRFKIRFRGGLSAVALAAAAPFALAASSPLPAAAAGGEVDPLPLHPKGGAGLSFQVDVIGNSGAVADLPVVGPIVFDPFAPSPLLLVDVAADVLCIQNGVQQGVDVELTDTNGRMTLFQGFESIAYYPTAAAPVAGLTLRVDTNINPKCAAIPAVAKVVSTEGSPVVCDAADTLFGDSFENAGGGAGSGPNLQVDFRLVSHPNTSTGDPAEYEIHVTNCGDATATSVGVRDLYPTSMALPPKLLSGGGWTCTGGTTCGENGYINQVFSQILPGGSRVITATRQLEAGVAGEMIQVSAAAISLSATADAQPANNAGSWQFEIRDNDPPTVTLTGTADSLAEDDGTVAITGVTIAAADSDGSIVSVAVNSLNTSLLTIDSVDDADPANVLVNVTTVADAFGTATLEVIATDDLGGNSTAMTFQVAVDPVNDPPSITVRGGFDYNDGTPMFGANCTEASAAGCADQNYPSGLGASGPFDANYLDWVVQVSPGPSNESGQVTTISLGAPSDPSLFLGANFEPELIDRGGTWDLDYGLVGDSGTATLVITVDDGEAVNNQTTLSFDIVVANSPPSVTAGQSFQVTENSPAPGVVGTLVGTDPEMDSLQDWTIVGGNVDVDMDSSLPFWIDPASGEITVNDSGDLDFEITTSFNLSVTVSDGNSTGDPESVAVTLSDVNDNVPVVASGLLFLVPENSVNCLGNPGTCTVTASDPDTVGSLQDWAIVSGNVDVDDDMNLPFAIDGGTGLITVADVGDMDFEAMSTFSLEVTVGDGVNTSDPQLVTIDLLDGLN